MYMLNKKSNILVLCPHPDDEIGCGGLIAKLSELGHSVYYSNFSNCAESTRALGYEPDQLLHEMRLSCAQLGIDENKIISYDFPVRKFPQYRQEILEEMVVLKNKIQPKLVLAPCSFDLHQDHMTIANEAMRAFKHSTILGYEFVWNSLKTELNFFVQLDEHHLDSKLNSWECYKSQQARPYHGPEIFRALAQVRGLMANVKFAEAFEARRVII
jgi:LmbE family N-acetylglucosaminyl deacetylase